MEDENRFTIKMDEELDFELNLGLEQITGYKFTQLVHKFKAESFQDGIDKLADMLKCVSKKFDKPITSTHTTSYKQEVSDTTTTAYYCPFCLITMEFKQKVNSGNKTVSWYSCNNIDCNARKLSRYSSYGISFFPSVLERQFKEYLVVPNTFTNVPMLTFEALIKYSNDNERKY